MACEPNKFQRGRHQGLPDRLETMHRTWEEDHHARQCVNTQVKSNCGSRQTSGLRHHLECALPPRVQRDLVRLGNRQDEVPSHPDTEDDGYKGLLIHRCYLGIDVRSDRYGGKEMHLAWAIKP